MESSQKEDNKNENFEKCVICMEKYKLDEEVETLPCFHIFHKDCIDQWLKAGKDTCPICKNKVKKFLGKSIFKYKKLILFVEKRRNHII